MLSHLSRSLRQLFRFKRGPVYAYSCVDTEPELLQRGEIYVVGAPHHQWAVAFKCPCGCGEDIWLNLIEGHPQRWRVAINSKGQLSLSPSVNRVVGCRSHFILQNNRVFWCYPRRLSRTQSSATERRHS